MTSPVKEKRAGEVTTKENVQNQKLYIGIYYKIQIQIYYEDLENILVLFSQQV